VFHRENNVLRRGTGVAVEGATIKVYVTGTDTAGDYTAATKATIYPTNVVGAAIAGSVLTSDANGHYEYYAPDGVYDEVLTYGSITEADATFKCSTSRRSSRRPLLMLRLLLPRRLLQPGARLTLPPRLLLLQRRPRTLGTARPTRLLQRSLRALRAMLLSRLSSLRKPARTPLRRPEATPR
jgi:hypothetical protein